MMKNKKLYWILGASVVILSAVFINRLNSDGTVNGNTSIKTAHSEENQASAAPAGDEVIFKDGEGKKVSLKELQGKVVFINFWATWCPPCIHEMPSINTLQAKFKSSKDIVFLMVDVDGNHEKSNAFMKDNNYDLSVYIPGSKIPSSYLGTSIPTTVILNKKGELAERMEGGRDYATQEMEEYLKQLVAM